MKKELDGELVYTCEQAETAGRARTNELLADSISRSEIRQSATCLAQFWAGQNIGCGWWRPVAAAYRRGMLAQLAGDAPAPDHIWMKLSNTDMTSGDRNAMSYSGDLFAHAYYGKCARYFEDGKFISYRGYDEVDSYTRFRITVPQAEVLLRYASSINGSTRQLLYQHFQWAGYYVGYPTREFSQITIIPLADVAVLREAEQVRDEAKRIEEHERYVRATMHLTKLVALQGMATSLRKPRATSFTDKEGIPVSSDSKTGIKAGDVSGNTGNIAFSANGGRVDQSYSGEEGQNYQRVSDTGIELGNVTGNSGNVAAVANGGSLTQNTVTGTQNNVRGNQFNSPHGDQFIGNRNVSTGGGGIYDVGHITGNSGNMAFGDDITQSYSDGGRTATQAVGNRNVTTGSGHIEDYGGVQGGIHNYGGGEGAVNSGRGVQTTIRAGNITGNSGNMAFGSGITQSNSSGDLVADPKATVLLDALDELRDTLDDLTEEQRVVVRSPITVACRSLRGGVLDTNIVTPALQQAATAMRDWDLDNERAALKAIAANAGLTIR